MTAPTDQIWAYLHDELAPEEKMDFERVLQNDPALRDAFEERRMTHRELQWLHDGEFSEEAMLAEWEAEHPEYAEAPAQKPRRNILRFTLPLAAAAAAVILIALPRNSESIHWQRTAYGSAPQLRGQPAAQAHYTRSELRQSSRELQNTIETASRQPEQWTLKISLQELIDGALSVEVSGHPRTAPETSRVWNKNFQRLEDFRQKVPLFGKQIADDLAEQVNP